MNVIIISGYCTNLSIFSLLKNGLTNIKDTILFQIYVLPYWHNVSYFVQNQYSREKTFKYSDLFQFCSLDVFYLSPIQSIPFHLIIIKCRNVILTQSNFY